MSYLVAFAANGTLPWELSQVVLQSISNEECARLYDPDEMFDTQLCATDAGNGSCNVSTSGSLFKAIVNCLTLASVSSPAFFF